MRRSDGAIVAIGAIIVALFVVAVPAQGGEVPLVSTLKLTSMRGACVRSVCVAAGRGYPMEDELHVLLECPRGFSRYPSGLKRLNPLPLFPQIPVLPCR